MRPFPGVEPPAVEHPVMEADVVIVGAGPAGLACALRLTQLIQAAGTAAPFKAEGVVVLEKGRDIGAHLLSGAVLDPRALRELLPDFPSDAPLDTPVGDDAAFLLTERRAWRFPITPPPLRNHGNYVVSLNRLMRWLGEKVEAAGVTVFTSVAGTALMMAGERVEGVRTDDKGVDRDGNAKSNFEPGYSLKAPMVVLAEGPRGSLSKQLALGLGLAGANPQVYGLGVKEIWEIPAGRSPAGRVFHTMGWPLPAKMYGGGWIYGLSDRQVSLGLVTGLDYRDPRTDPHHLFQRFKTHPMLREMLAGGEMLRYGAKTMPMGGWFAMPPASGAGWLMVGDAGGYLNSQRLKGIHLAMKSGMLAAEAIFAAFQAGQPTQAADFAQRIAASWIREEMWRVRNFHQGFSGGLVPGLWHAAWQQVSGGRGFRSRYPAEEGHARLVQLSHLGVAPQYDKPDGRLTFDKTADVFHSGTRHAEDQPSHLHIADLDVCHDRCRREYGNPCQHFCPAQVYEMVEADDGKMRLQVNSSNCVHCKTCDIMDPYGIITWVPPEGGGGPNYEGM